MSYSMMFQQDTTLCSRCRAAECINVHIAQKITNDLIAWINQVTALPYSVLFYSSRICSMTSVQELLCK